MATIKTNENSVRNQKDLCRMDLCEQFGAVH
jgi:hypothetical protein